MIQPNCHPVINNIFSLFSTTGVQVSRRQIVDSWAKEP